MCYGIFFDRFASDYVLSYMPPMPPMLSRLFVVFFALVVSSFAANEQHVKASLVSEVTSVQPGKPFVVALRLEHEPHWHTYWVNPGTGYPTSLKWTLPAGWSAGDFRWPTPVVLHDRTGNVVGNGYENEALLPLTITPSKDAKPGESVTLRAKAEWLMCSDVCMPGDANVELTLPVSADEPKFNEEWHRRIEALPMPKAADAFEITAAKQDKKVVLHLKAKSDAAPKLKQPHFFSQDGFVQYDEEQNVQSSENGYTLTLPISDTADAATTKLVGVVSSQDPLQGISIDVPLSGVGANSTAGTNGAAPGNTGSTPGASNAGSSASSSAPANGASAGAVVQSLSIGVLALAFVGGLILNLMPCVFPVLGIKILGFVNQAGADRSKVTAHGLAFTGGVLVSFWALAGLLAVLRAGGSQLGWGFQLQSPVFVFVLAVVLLIFALSMSGLFEVGLSATAVGSGLQSKSGYAGSFFTGILATVVATPCSAPFLAPALGAALAMPTAESFAVFTAIAIGLSLPYLLLSIFPQAVKLLPRHGAWMETFKQVMAFPLYATVAALVWVLAGQTKNDDYALLYVLFGLTLVALAAWIYGRYTAPGAKPGRVRFGVIAGIVFLAFGVFVGWPREASPTDIVWEPWSAEAVAKLRAEKRIIYVDFTARWCATCQTNKKLVFTSSEVKKVFRDKKIATLKGDWTNRDPKITAELAKWNRSAVPFNLIYKPDSTEPIVLPEILTSSTVLQALR